MFDVVVRGGEVVTPDGVGYLDIGVRGEQIAALGPLGSLSVESSRVIDATGAIVVPGGIDPHVHSQWALPSRGGEALGYSAGPEDVSMAALFGGTTTWIDFAMWSPGQTLEQAIEARKAEWAGQCHNDYAFHVIVQGELPPGLVDQIPEVVREGFASFKIFTTDITPSRRGRMLGFGDLWEVLRTVAAAGGITAVHAEDNDLVMHMYRKLEREGRSQFQNMAEVHSALSEDLAFRRVIRLAEHIEGAALYMMHVSAAEGVAAIEESRARGYPIYGETLHQYALYGSDDYLRPNGQIYHTYPSLKSSRDRAALWAGMRTGAIRTVATDGICTTLEDKIRGSRVDDVTGGNAGVEARMGVMYTESVVRRGYPLTTFVDLTSANAARLLGLYPRKGAILVGSDADLVVIDPSVRRTLRASDLHETDYSPWDGWDIEGWPVLTMLRGKIMVENGQFYGDPRRGQLLKRKVSDAIRSPA